MKIHFLSIIVMLLISPTAMAQDPFAQIQQSHIDTNVPPADVFDTLLHRDLLVYFRSAHIAKATDVTYKLLRDGPTQSGVAYPKYYLWVRIVSGAKVIDEGAVRVAAIERTRFEVTDYLSRSDVKASPSSVGAIFPTLLVQDILSLAGVK